MPLPGRGAAVVVTRALALFALLACGLTARAAVLPEERVDTMAHYYGGGGVDVMGPAILVRKNFKDTLSVSASYYADMISSASIDVVTTASPYTDQRDETGVGIDYLSGDGQASLNVLTSKEKDYQADTISLGLSQEFRQGLTVLSLGFTRGMDTVGKTLEPTFSEKSEHFSYRLGWSQVVSKRQVFSVDYESVSDKGYLNNPYRVALVVGSPVPERYPETRSSHALGVQSIYALNDISSLRTGYRYYKDSWGIKAHTLEGAYARYVAGRRWLLEGHARYYQQNNALFYSDNFSLEQTYMARDKELSTFKSLTLGIKATYDLTGKVFTRLTRVTANVGYDLIVFGYDDFTGTDGKPYGFNASVIQGFLSFWF